MNKEILRYDPLAIDDDFCPCHGSHDYKPPEPKKSFIQRVKEYYPTYLSVHQNKWNRRMHLLGQIATYSYLSIILYHMIISSLLFSFLLIPTPFIVYLFAWTGHLVFEKNKPATWSVSPAITKACDLVMMWDIITGKIPF